jgi:hypothetical protein
MVEDDLHLFPAMLARAVDVKMHCDRAEGAARVLDVGDQCAQMSEPFLFAPHFVFPVWKRDRMNIFHRPLREHPKPVDRPCIFSLNLRLNTAAFLESYIHGRECVI